MGAATMKVAISGYEIIQTLHEGDRVAIYRAYSQQRDKPVIIKLLRVEYPTLEDITRLRHEYSILQNLQSAGVIVAYQLEKYRHSFALILEDINGKSLKEIVTVEPLPIRDVLQIAIAIAQTLAELYRAGIVHKDVKPSNIIVNWKTQQVKLIDFGCASRLPLENPTLKNPNSIEGTLTYMSPEQTGRMNRAIDCRTDLYSLGATLYELLTGQPPFIAEDPIELIHCHIAKPPVPPKELRQMPEVLSQIICKLLAKNAEDRYQTAAGLKFDLDLCLKQWEVGGKIESFVLGSRDRGHQLVLPQKLYGREAEIATLMAAFHRVALGRSEFISVSGYSGIGKTSIVNEVHKPMAAARGYFIAGKFDQLKRDTPYIALIQAFQALLRQILTESADKVATWQALVLEALGDNGRAIAEVIPELELLIGTTPEIPKLGAKETQNRFNRAFRQFVGVFCQPGRPLVIFLDDLQWADSGSLNLLELLLSEESDRHLLAIGAYRDREVSTVHPLIQTLEAMHKNGTAMQEIAVKPLDLDCTNLLLADTLNTFAESQEILTFGELIYNKTQGNPFFLTQTLKALYDDNLLVYQVESDRWVWDIQQIQAIGINDGGIVELIARKIRKLPPETQNVLKLAACIGNKFRLDVLSTVNQASEVTTAKQLWAALQAGSILPVSETYKIPLAFRETEASNFAEVEIVYRFLHDRVQQAVYSLIPESERQATHLKIGQLLLANTAPSQKQENLFALVHQLNFGIDLLSDPTPRYELARLNLMAGIKAKAANAYSSAVKYLESGIQLLFANSWETEYELTRDLYTEAVEATYLNTDFKAAENLSEIALQRFKTALEKARIYGTKIQFYIAQNQMQEAIDIGLEALALLGVSRSQTPPAVEDIAQLYALPMMESPEKLEALHILVSLHAPAYIANPALLYEIVLTTIDFCINEGHSPLAPFAYAYYGVLLCGVLGDIELGYRYGQLAQWLLAQLDAREIQCKVEVLLNACIWHWKEPTILSTTRLRQAISTGLDTGDLEYASTAIATWCAQIITLSEPLDSLSQQQNSYLSLLRTLKQDFYIDCVEIWCQFLENLRGITDNPTQLSGSVFEEAEKLASLQATKNFTSLYIFHLVKTILCYLFKDYEQAGTWAIAGFQYQLGVASLTIFSQLPFYHSLILLAGYSQASAEIQQQLMVTLNEYLQQLQTWARHAPANYQHKYALVAAQKARVLRRVGKAMAFYEEAIKNAKANEYIYEEALAYELAGEFYLELNMEEISKNYLLKAHNAYIRWGAIAKVRSLESTYSLWLATVEVGSPNVSSRTSSSSPNILDSLSVIKASQVLAGEIVFDRLLEKLMKIAIENAGAQTGCLILKQGDRLLVEVEGAIDEEKAIARPSIPIENHPGIPVSLINYVARTKEDVILADASREGEFTNDPYIINRRPRSLLCTAIAHQGQLVGLLYLENNLTAGAFTPNRLEVLKVLSAQAAISLENARLYRDMTVLNASLTQEVEERQRAEAALRQSEKQLAQFLEGVPVGVFVVDVKGHPYYANQRAQQILGRGIVPAATGDRLSEIYQTYIAGTNELYPSDRLPIARALQGETGTIDDLEIRQQDQTIPVEVWATPIFDDRGKIVYAIAAFQDITQRQQAEAERLQFTEELALKNLALQQAKERLADINRTLEDKVRERTQELSQTLDILKATQAELEIENALLRSAESPPSYDYQVGGSLPLVHNRIYREVFDRCWVDRILAGLSDR